MPMKSKSRPAPSRRREEEEEEETTTRRGREDREERTSSNGKRKSLAQAFDDAKASGSVPDGKYAALIIEFKVNETNKNGTSAQVRYEIADEGEQQGDEVVQFYGLLDAEGNEAKGLGYLKRDLAILGHGDVRFKDLEDTLKEIQDEMPGVNITVKNNPPYTNAYLNGLNEDDVIEEWKRERPDKPY